MSFITRYTIQQKLLFGFSFLLLIMISMAVLTYGLNNRISEDTYQIRNVEAPLELMVQEVIGYDAMLTGDAYAALLHAKKGNTAEVSEFKQKYDEVGVKLDTLLKTDARNLLEKSKRSQEQKDEVYGYLSELDRVNLLLVDLETGAFSAIENGSVDVAYSLIVSEQYEIYKKELYDLYLKWGSAEQQVTNSYREQVLRDSRNVVLVNVFLSILSIILAIIISVLITFTITSPLRKLRNVAEELSAGNLNVKISPELKKTNGEIGKLANAYDLFIRNSEMGMKKFVEYNLHKFKKGK